MPEALGMIELALVATIAGVAGFVTGLAGFGTGLVAAGFWLHLVPAPFVPPMVAINSVAAQIASLPAVRREVRWRALTPYLIGAVIGIPLGVLVLRHTSSFLLRPAVGIFLVAFTTFEFIAAGRFGIGARGGRAADGVVGTCGGFLGGFAGLSAPVPVVWLRLRGGPSDAQRAIYQPFNLLVLSGASLAMGIDGQIDRNILMVAGFCLPATLIGSWLGMHCYWKVNQGTFRRVVLGLLFLAGLTLLISR